jgi:hypothetical protein
MCKGSNISRCRVTINRSKYYVDNWSAERAGVCCASEVGTASSILSATNGELHAWYQAVPVWLQSGSLTDALRCIVRWPAKTLKRRKSIKNAREMYNAAERSIMVNHDKISKGVRMLE